MFSGSGRLAVVTEWEAEIGEREIIMERRLKSLKEERRRKKCRDSYHPLLPEYYLTIYFSFIVMKQLRIVNVLRYQTIINTSRIFYLLPYQ